MDETLRQLLESGKEHYAKRDFATARVCLEQVTERHENFADVFNMLGVIYHDLGLFSKAQSALETAIKLNPLYTEAALNLAVLYNDLGKYGEARDTYGRALAYCKAERGAHDPFVAGKIANMHADIGDAYRAAGQIEPAIVEYEKAVTLRPGFADLRAKLATALIDNRQYTLAAQELERALRDRPAYLGARVQLGTCYYTMGRLDEAVRQWTQVLQQEPANSAATMYLRLVHTARHPASAGVAEHA